VNSVRASRSRSKLPPILFACTATISACTGAHGISNSARADLSCPVPKTRVDTSDWQEFRARNASFTIRLPAGSRDSEEALHPDVTQIWEVGPPQRSWDVTYLRPHDLYNDLNPALPPSGEGITRRSRVQFGPCQETIGARDATVWVGEWVSRGMFAYLPYQVIVHWHLGPDQELFILAQTRTKEDQARALAALRSVRFEPTDP
jgi:hypothetical protein